MRSLALPGSARGSGLAAQKEGEEEEEEEEEQKG